MFGKTKAVALLACMATMANAAVLPLDQRQQKMPGPEATSTAVTHSARQQKMPDPAAVSSATVIISARQQKMPEPQVTNIHSARQQKMPDPQATNIHFARQQKMPDPASATNVHSARQQKMPDPQATNIHSARQQKMPDPASATNIHSARQQKMPDPQATNIHSARQQKMPDPASATNIHSARQQKMPDPASATNIHSARQQKMPDPAAASSVVVSARQQKMPDPASATNIHSARQQKMPDPAAASSTVIVSARQQKMPDPASATNIHSARQQKMPDPAATTGGAVSARQQKMPDPASATSAIHSARQQKMPDPASASTAIHTTGGVISARQQKMPDPASATTVNHSARQQKMPDPASATAVAHSARQQKMPEPAAATTVVPAPEVAEALGFAPSFTISTKTYSNNGERIIPRQWTSSTETWTLSMKGYPVKTLTTTHTIPTQTSEFGWPPRGGRPPHPPKRDNTGPAREDAEAFPPYLVSTTATMTIVKTKNGHNVTRTKTKTSTSTVGGRICMPFQWCPDRINADHEATEAAMKPRQFETETKTIVSTNNGLPVTRTTAFLIRTEPPRQPPRDITPEQDNADDNASRTRRRTWTFPMSDLEKPCPSTAPAMDDAMTAHPIPTVPASLPTVRARETSESWVFWNESAWTFRTDPKPTGTAVTWTGLSTLTLPNTRNFTHTFTKLPHPTIPAHRQGPSGHGVPNLTVETSTVTKTVAEKTKTRKIKVTETVYLNGTMSAAPSGVTQTLVLTQTLVRRDGPSGVNSTSAPTILPIGTVHKPLTLPTTWAQESGPAPSIVTMITTKTRKSKPKTRISTVSSVSTAFSTVTSTEVATTTKVIHKHRPKPNQTDAGLGPVATARRRDEAADNSQ